LDALERVADDLDAGRTVDLDEFDAVMTPLSDELARATYNMVNDRSFRFPSGEDMLRAHHKVHRCLDEAHRSLRADVRGDRIGESGTSPRTWEMLEEAHRARASLNATLLNRIEEISGGSFRHQ